MSAPSEARRQARLLARVGRTGMRHVLTEARLALRGQARGPKAVLLILGCQRSGTTLMTELLESDPGAKVYPEHSILSLGDSGSRIRLGPLTDVSRRVAKSRHSLVVLKPLVESQRTAELLDQIARARGLWMFRHWRDVARSNLARFGKRNGVHNLRSIVERAGDWRSERLDGDVVNVVGALYDPKMSLYDAAALFWWARNSLFFTQELARDERILTCRYEELVEDPMRELKRIYGHVGLPLNAAPGPSHVSRSSVGRGSAIEVSPEIAKLCDEMESRLLLARDGATR